MSIVYLLMFLLTPQGIALKAFPMPSADACITAHVAMEEELKAMGDEAPVMTFLCVDSGLSPALLLPGRDA